jgi:hypothetical protein
VPASMLLILIAIFFLSPPSLLSSGTGPSNDERASLGI